MNISLTGSNTWQSGEDVFEYTVSPEGAISLDGYDPANTDEYSTIPIRTRAVDAQLAFEYQHLLTQAFAAKRRGAMDAYTLFNSATNVTLPPGVPFPDTELANQFKMVARAIAGHSTLGHSRQTFFIEYGGWDHHDGVIAQQAEMLPEVDAAVKAFYDCLAALGLENSVTLFTASDFGRTLTTDSDGADHAWGGNHFVVGGAVNGQRLYGNYPSLYIDNPLDVGRGRLRTQVSVDSYFAELALWLGVPKSSLPPCCQTSGTFITLATRPLRWAFWANAAGRNARALSDAALLISTLESNRCNAAIFTSSLSGGRGARCHGSFSVGSRNTRAAAAEIVWTDDFHGDFYERPRSGSCSRHHRRIESPVLCSNR